LWIEVLADGPERTMSTRESTRPGKKPTKRKPTTKPSSAKTAGKAALSTSAEEYFGVHVGIVTNTGDPEGRGRVRVQIPSLPEGHETAWARISVLFLKEEFAILAEGLSSPGPGVGDMVAVAFEDGRMDRPRVLGLLFAGERTATDAEMRPHSDTATSALPSSSPSLGERAAMIKSINELVGEHLQDPQGWLNAANPRFGNKSPREMIEAGREKAVYDVLRAYDLGLFS
jgi:hypothetical protein